MLLNVRLGPEEERLVKGLRRAKINVSALVRKAIREAAGELKPRSRVEVLKEILSRIPAPEQASRGRPPLDDRLALKAYLRERIKRRR